MKTIDEIVQLGIDKHFVKHDVGVKKVKEYQSLLGLNNDELYTFFKGNPHLFEYAVANNSPFCVNAKLNFLVENLAITYNDAIKLVKKSPKILDYDMLNDEPTSLITKLNFLSKSLNLTQQELGQLIQNYPKVLDYDINKGSLSGIRANISLLKSWGVTKQDIISNAMLLALPASKIRLRYMILNLANPNKNNLLSHDLLKNEGILYARYRYLNSIKEPWLKSIGASENYFKNKYKVNTPDLLIKYPISEAAINKLEELFNKQSSDKNWRLTPIEREAVITKKAEKVV